VDESRRKPLQGRCREASGGLTWQRTLASAKLRQVGTAVFNGKHRARQSRACRAPWSLTSEPSRGVRENPRTRLRLLIIEPDRLRREGLVAYLGREADLKVVGEGSDLEEALTSISAPFPGIDVLLVNVDSSQARHLRYWAVVRMALPPKARIIVLCRATDLDSLETLLSFGIKGLYPADAEPERICQAVRNVAKGRMDYDAGLADRLKAELMLPAREEGIRIGELAIDRLTGEIRLPDGRVHLTVREKEVLKLLSTGLGNRQIAGRLGITERTAVFHVGNLLRKLGLSSRVEAALVARWLQD